MGGGGNWGSDVTPKEVTSVVRYSENMNDYRGASVSAGWRFAVRLYVAVLIAALVVVGLWAPDNPVTAQSGCANQGAVSPSETDLASDCEVLLDVRDTLAGTATLNWAADTPIEDWDGISVAGTPLRVTEIYLDSRRLTGTIPPELGNLSNLTSLSLRGNQLTGEIPSDLGKLDNLSELYLGINQLIGAIPSELGDLSNLAGLDLGVNQLSGAIPSELGNLSNLGGLDLAGNQLSGPIPSELGNLFNLTGLLLAGNQLNGPIPSELGNLSSLTGLGLWGNELSSPIPSELGNLSNLTVLWLHNNTEVPSERV